MRFLLLVSCLRSWVRAQAKKTGRKKSTVGPNSSREAPPSEYPPYMPIFSYPELSKPDLYTRPGFCAPSERGSRFLKVWRPLLTRRRRTRSSPRAESSTAPSRRPTRAMTTPILEVTESNSEQETLLDANGERITVTVSHALLDAACPVGRRCRPGIVGACLQGSA